jgi:mono/diheme cytochrome c family protein
MRLVPAALFLIFVFSIPALASSGSQRARGADLLASSGCQHCHSIRNQGGKRGPDLSGVGKMKKAEIRRQIANGGKAMPAFGGVLAPKEIDDLVAYLRSCRDKPKNSTSH